MATVAIRQVGRAPAAAQQQQALAGRVERQAVAAVGGTVGKRSRSPAGTEPQGVAGRDPANLGRRSGDELESASPAMPDQSTQTRALRNMRSQPPSSCQSSGRQEFCTARNTRSGCGIMMVTRPSRLLSPVMPRGDPLGLAG